MAEGNGHGKQTLDRTKLPIRRRPLQGVVSSTRGLPQPSHIDGVQQEPMHETDAAERHTQQYFEISPWRTSTPPTPSSSKPGLAEAQAGMGA
jgi:hypothetical protein